jgi:hypothetical protein
MFFVFSYLVGGWFGLISRTRVLAADQVSFPESALFADRKFATALNALFNGLAGILDGVWRLACETAQRDLAIPCLKLHMAFPARKAFNDTFCVVRAHSVSSRPA